MRDQRGQAKRVARAAHEDAEAERNGVAGRNPLAQSPPAELCFSVKCGAGVLYCQRGAATRGGGTSHSLLIKRRGRLRTQDEKNRSHGDSSERKVDLVTIKISTWEEAEVGEYLPRNTVCRPRTSEEERHLELVKLTAR